MNMPSLGLLLQNQNSGLNPDPTSSCHRAVGGGWRFQLTSDQLVYLFLRTNRITERDSVANLPHWCEMRRPNRVRQSALCRVL